MRPAVRARTLGELAPRHLARGDRGRRRRGRVTLGFPRGLFDATLVRVYAEAFTAALELANARKPRVDLLAEEPGVARYRASWQ